MVQGVSRLMKQPLQLFVKVFAGLNEMDNYERARMVDRASNAVLGLAARKMKRIQHVERTGESLARERVLF